MLHDDDAVAITSVNGINMVYDSRRMSATLPTPLITDWLCSMLFATITIDVMPPLDTCAAPAPLCRHVVVYASAYAISLMMMLDAGCFDIFAMLRALILCLPLLRQRARLL